MANLNMNTMIILMLALLLAALPSKGIASSGNETTTTTAEAAAHAIDEYIPDLTNYSVVEYLPGGGDVLPAEVVSLQCSDKCRCCLKSDPNSCMTTSCCLRTYCTDPSASHCTVVPIACNCNNCP